MTPPGAGRPPQDTDTRPRGTTDTGTDAPDPRTARRLVLRYFAMWNTGDTALADDILHPEWTDHAHPDIAGVEQVRQAVEHVRAAQPDLRFDIDAVLAEGDLFAAVGRAVRTAHPEAAPHRLIWLIRVRDGRMAEMWTYRNDPPG